MREEAGASLEMAEGGEAEGGKAEVEAAAGAAVVAAKEEEEEVEAAECPGRDDFPVAMFFLKALCLLVVSLIFFFFL